jgi:dihydroorotase (multifunctional complex type)
MNAGVIGFKLMASSLDKAEGAKVFTIPEDGARLLKILKEVAETRLPLAVHSEDFKVRAALEKEKKENSLKAYVKSIPAEVEASAAARILILASLTDLKIHIVHASSKLTVNIIRLAKKLGVKVTAETCPHYLLLTIKDAERLGVTAKIDPPLKFEEDAEALWSALNEEVIDLIASDHSPHTVEEKLKAGSIWKAPAGFCGVETLLPLMLTQVNAGRLSLQRLVRLLAENPAKIFGLWGVKGAVETGFDADLTLIDIGKEWTIKADKLHSKSKVTPWNGWRVKGFPILTLVRGEIVAENGEPVGKPGWGRLVKPKTL